MENVTPSTVVSWFAYRYYRLRNRDRVPGLETAHVSHRLNTSHGRTLRVALTEAAERGSSQANVSAMAKLRQRAL